MIIWKKKRADAWDKSVAKTKEQGDVFPDDIDADQDGVVYYLLPADWDGNYDMEPVDGAKVYDYKFVGLSHNTVRGAAGGAVLCAEFLTAKGYIARK